MLIFLVGVDKANCLKKLKHFKFCEATDPNCQFNPLLDHAALRLVKKLYPFNKADWLRFKKLFLKLRLPISTLKSFFLIDVNKHWMKKEDRANIVCVCHFTIASKGQFLGYSWTKAGRCRPPFINWAADQAIRTN